jgi:hypothetical protein
MLASYDELRHEAESLSGLSADALIEELGRRVNTDMGRTGQGRAGTFGSEEVLKDIGHRWWKHLEPELMGLICDPTNKDMQQLTGNRSVPQLAAGLAAAAVAAAVSVPPTWLIVATTLLAMKVTDAGLQALCEAWSDRSGSGLGDQRP